SSVERIDGMSFTVKDGGVRILVNAPGGGATRDGGIYDSDDPEADLAVNEFTVRVPAGSGGPGEAPGLPVPLLDAPDVTGDFRFKVMEGGEYTLTADDILASDGGVTPPDALIYRLTTLPSSGTLWLGGRSLAQFDTF